MWSLKALMLTPQFAAAATLIIGADALSHLHHYLWNSGDPYEIDLEDMLDDVPSAKQAYDRELALAKAYVQTLPTGTYLFTSSSLIPAGTYNYESESTNWFYAIGGYSAWSKGVATIARDTQGNRGYRMDFEYKVYDRYNWDTGKSVEIFGITITDEFMGDFHRQGLAKEFDCNGSVTSTETWGTPGAIPPPPASRRGLRGR
jgi:hypothetical protein